MTYYKLVDSVARVRLLIGDKLEDEIIKSLKPELFTNSILEEEIIESLATIEKYQLVDRTIILLRNWADSYLPMEVIQPIWALINNMQLFSDVI